MISTGGDAVYSDGAMQYKVHRHRCLSAPPAGRSGTACGEFGHTWRCLHSGCNTLEDLYEERCPLYEKYADLMVDFTGCTVEQCHEKLLKTVKAYLSEHPDC